MTKQNATKFQHIEKFFCLYHRTQNFIYFTNDISCRVAKTFRRVTNFSTVKEMLYPSQTCCSRVHFLILGSYSGGQHSSKKSKILIFLISVEMLTLYYD